MRRGAAKLLNAYWVLLRPWGRSWGGRIGMGISRFRVGCEVCIFRSFELCEGLGIAVVGVLLTDAVSIILGSNEKLTQSDGFAVEHHRALFMRIVQQAIPPLSR